jgi:anti-sigma regulatory factor (Ser/Thr protein kinase)
MTGEQFSCVLPAAARSVTEARRFVLDALRSWGRDDFGDTAALLTSEVVTNAVLHARTSVELVVRQLAEGICVEVTDGSVHQPQSRVARDESTNGRGLALLEELAAAWEVTQHAAGKTVRFTLNAGRDPWAAYRGVNWSDA